MLTDKQWKIISPLLPSEKGHHGRPYTGNHRTTVEAVLWIARTGAPWRDLPERFGKWNTVYRRFRRWSNKGVFDKVLAAINEGSIEVAMVDGTFVKVHQHGAGALKEEALPMPPDAFKPSGEAVEGLPRRSPQSQTCTDASYGSP